MTCPLGKCDQSKCPNLAFCLSQYGLERRRETMQYRVINRQQAADEAREMKGVIVGHDSTTNEYLVEVSGQIIRATSISNSFHKIGEIVALVVPFGSAKAVIDKMPV